MKRRTIDRLALAAAATIAVALGLSLAGCKNAIADEVTSIQEKTISPIFSLIDASSNKVGANSVVTFPDTAPGNKCDLVFTITNSGKTDLVIGSSGIAVAMGSGTEPGSFSIASQPPSSIPPGGKVSISLRYAPVSLGAKSASVALSTNDVNTPSFSFTLKGGGVSGGKDITAFGISSPVAAVGFISGAAIGVNVPTGTNVALLVPTFATTGVLVSIGGVAQTSGVSVVDFSSPVTYVVKAADSTTKSYVVTVSVAATKPSLTTAAVGGIAWATASGGGNVTSDGGAPVIERGLCWSATVNPPTLANSSVASGTFGTGSFSSCLLSGLLPGTSYYVCAYATNGAGTGYGPSVSFTTTAATAPTTATVTAINATSATVGCTAVADSGVTVKECGVCWSTSSGPTIADSHASGASGASIAVSGLSIATTYYVRAYAILYTGSASVTTTVYGAEKSYKTVGYPGPSGGYVFYDRGVVIDGWRYLEAAPSDLGPYIFGPVISISTGTGIGTGYQNTYDICRAGGYNYPAAAYSFNATYGGNTGFFLPSKDELNLMMVNLSANSLGGIASHPYWSSSASGTSAAYYQTNAFTSGIHPLSSEKYVRAVRQYQ